MNRLLNFFDQRPKIGKLLSISFVVILLVVSFQYYKHDKNTRITKLLHEKNYVELTSVLNEQSYSKDEQMLFVYSKIMMDYDCDDINSINSAKYELSKIDNSYNGQYAGMISELKQNVQDDYDYLIAETEKKEEEKKKKAYLEAMEKNKAQNNKSITGTGLPCKGMRETALAHTSLGAPTEIEICPDFDKLRAHRKNKTYRWYKNGIKTIGLNDLLAVADISYYDFKEDKEVPGYVSSIHFYGEYQQYNEQ